MPSPSISFCTEWEWIRSIITESPMPWAVSIRTPHAAWPAYDLALTVEDQVEVVVQVSE